ncbi:hypothetical protein HDV01_002075 [Terramyces sp. JEL0728]|nr:hypothetical protein HDV01_002075 [Terramyces sp. JEL0728]
MQQISNLLDGQLRVPTVTEFLESKQLQCVQDAYTLEPVSQLLATDTTALELALQTAHGIHQSKAWLNNKNKKQIFDRLADELENSVEGFAIADCKDVGTTVSQARDINGYGHRISRSLEYLTKGKSCEWAELLENDKVVGKSKHLPIGPVVVIAKPSPWSPHSFDLLAKAFVNAEFPPGVFQICHGGMEVGRYLVESPLSKQFASPALQKEELKLSRVAPSLKPIVMELGGCNPFIVLKGADLEKAVDSLIQSLTQINGQYCCGPSKVIVHEKELDLFIQGFKNKVSQLVLGNPQDEATTQGPICAGLANTLKTQMADLLAHPNSYSITGNDVQFPNEKGTFVPPTLIFMESDVSIELFGPVATLHSINSVEQAIALANNTDAILKGYVFGEKEETVLVIESVETCWFDENQFDMGTPGLKEPHSWGGNSGFGYALPEFFVKSIYVRY